MSDNLILQHLETLWGFRGSDLLLSSGSHPRLRVSGELVDAPNSHVLTGDEIEQALRPFMTDAQRNTLEEQGDVDFAFSWLDRARLRANAYRQKGQVSVALRIIPNEIPTIEQLELPEMVARLATEVVRGFILVTGATGSGKSTTLASIVKRINETRTCHILTIEDPVEFVHESLRALVSQREVGTDTISFRQALRAALREDPDVILVGELRDAESIQIALTLAETGHLVLATLHTRDAAQAIDRILDVLPDGQKSQAQAQLASSFSAVVAQRLVPKVGGGLVAAFEVLTATTATRNTIREGRAHQLPGLIAMGRQSGMITMDAYLAKLVVEGVVERDSAVVHATSADELDGHIQYARNNRLYEMKR